MTKNTSSTKTKKRDYVKEYWLKFKHKKTLNFIFIVLAVVALFILSEANYMYHNPEAFNSFKKSLSSFKKNLELVSLERKYIHNLTEDETKSYLEKYPFSKISSLVLYAYLQGLNNKPDQNNCKPICISYDESQKMITVFERLESNHGFTYLNTKRQSNLYFWIATLSIWVHTDSEKTQKYVEQAVILNDKNESANLYNEDLKKITNLEKDQTAQMYFKEKLNKFEDKENYKRIYMSKAAFILGNLSRQSKENDMALTYYGKAIDLYPWNEDYFLAYSNVSSDKNPMEAKIILQQCVDYLQKDSISCQKELTKLKY